MQLDSCTSSAGGGENDSFLFRTPPSTPDSSSLVYPDRKRSSSPLVEARKHFRASPMHAKKPSSASSSAAAAAARRSAMKSSDFRGVSKCAKDGRWQARIRVGKKVKYLGRFRTEQAAAERYDEAALALHGRRANLNFELSPQELDQYMERVHEKRDEFGFTESDCTDWPKNYASRTSSRSNSPCWDGPEDDVSSVTGEENQDPTRDDQNAADRKSVV